MRPIVYLSGPMAGLTYEEGNVWRDQVKEALGEDIICLNPFRNLQHLGKVERYYKSSLGGYADHALTRDFLDTKRADLIAVNLLEATQTSIGTVMEIAWAHALQKPIIVAMREDDEFHKHILIEASINVLVRDLDSLIKITRDMLLSP